MCVCACACSFLSRRGCLYIYIISILVQLYITVYCPSFSFLKDVSFFISLSSMLVCYTHIFHVRILIDKELLCTEKEHQSCHINNVDMHIHVHVHVHCTCISDSASPWGIPVNIVSDSQSVCEGLAASDSQSVCEGLAGS